MLGGEVFGHSCSGCRSLGNRWTITRVIPCDYDFKLSFPAPSNYLIALTSTIRRNPHFISAPADHRFFLNKKTPLFFWIIFVWRKKTDFGSQKCSLKNAVYDGEIWRQKSPFTIYNLIKHLSSQAARKLMKNKLLIFTHKCLTSVNIIYFQKRRFLNKAFLTPHFCFSLWISRFFFEFFTF